MSGKGKTLNMDAETIAKIFDGKITKWNDDAIKKQNPKVDLPDLDITVVHRSDKSGTTKNFLSYVKDAAGDDMELRPRRELAERGRPGRQGHFRRDLHRAAG